MPDLIHLREAALHGVEELEAATAHAPRARRNLKLGLWAGRHLGHTGPELTRYVLSVMEADHEEAGDADVIRKLMYDFAAASLSVSKSEVQERAAEFKREAFAAMHQTD